MARPIITLTTDYGLNDHLVGTLKGVILKIVPEATIVDITHNVTPYDLLDGALAIGSAYCPPPRRPSFTSQISAVESALPEARNEPSGENSTAMISP